MMTEWDMLEQTYSLVKGEGGGGEYKPLPTGTYQAKIVENQFDLSKMLFKRKFLIISGEFTGKHQMDWIRLIKKDNSANDVSLDRVKSEIKKFDADWGKLPLKDACLPFCNSSLEQMVEIYVSTKEGVREDGAPTLNSTVYINEFIQLPDGTPF